jgi:hypothetical protein
MSSETGLFPKLSRLFGKLPRDPQQEPKSCCYLDRFDR